MLADQGSVVVCRTMNILIENAESLEFLASNNQWTNKAAAAKCFGRTPIALEAAKKELIGKFNIVAYIPATQQMINLEHGRGKGAAEAIPG